MLRKSENVICGVPCVLQMLLELSCGDAGAEALDLFQVVDLFGDEQIDRLVFGKISVGRRALPFRVIAAELSVFPPSGVLLDIVAAEAV
jgi:hypothetical protein